MPLIAKDSQTIQFPLKRLLQNTSRKLIQQSRDPPITVNKNSKNREGDTYHYIRQVMLLNISIIPKAPRVSYSANHILPQKRHIVLKPLKKAIHTGFIGSSRLNYTTLDLYPLISPRQVARDLDNVYRTYLYILPARRHCALNGLDKNIQLYKCYG